MPRSDLLLNLVKAGVQGDRSLFHRTVDAIIAEERAKQHNVLADQLEDTVRKNGKAVTQPPMSTNGSYHSLLHETQPQRTLGGLVLSELPRKTCDELIEEQMRADLLRSHSLEPRHRVLLIGPPGNGKTSLAEAIAQALTLPLLTVRYEGVVGSFLGETAVRSRTFQTGRGKDSDYLHVLKLFAPISSNALCRCMQRLRGRFQKR